MRKTVLFCILFAVYAINAQAQKKRIQLMAGAEFAQPVKEDLQAGYGISFKALYGISKTGQLTLSAGYSRFTEPGGLKPGNKPYVRLISVLAGYRQNFGRFFVEPQAGIGELGGTTYVVIQGDASRPSVTTAFSALNIGYTIRKLSFGARYQVAHGIDKSDAGIWQSRRISYAGLFAAYRLFEKK